MSTKPGRGPDSGSDEPKSNKVVSKTVAALLKKSRWMYRRVSNLYAWWTRRRLWHKIAIWFFLLVVVPIAINSAITHWLDYWDVGGGWFAHFESDDAAWKMQRGAKIMSQPSKFGNEYQEIRYLKQKWTPADSLWFYTTTQGSDLIPYDFFMVLQQPKLGKLFRSDDNLYDLGYLPQVKTSSNPDALPVGFVKDTYMGKDYIGFTCAACHTAQVNYQGIAMRIDGGPAGSDMDSFLKQLRDCLVALPSKSEARAQFIKDVLKRGHYSSAGDVENDLDNFTQRLALYEVENDSPVPYGYYRLDAFGRIFNRILEHILTLDQLKSVLNDMVRDHELTDARLDYIYKYNNGHNVLDGTQKDHLVSRLAQMLTPEEQKNLNKRIFNPPDAPVSYPFLWDIPQHDYVQWNGIVPNAGLGPVGRNTGEVTGVFATLDWAEKPGISLSSVISGQGFKGPHIDYKSSVNVHNLVRLEHHLESLESPQWPDDIFVHNKIDKDKSRRGEKLFSELCAGCHTNIGRDDSRRRVVANMTKLEDIGTDNKMALNAVSYNGLSGILRNQYTNSGGGPVLIDERAPVAALLNKATLSVVATPSANRNFIQRGLDWADDLITSFLSNSIKPSIKHGNYDPDTTAKPYESLKAYKGRSLNGIWATAPYLHNGSVPTLYDLLLPPDPKHTRDCKEIKPSGTSKPPVDTPGAEYRPNKFMVGSREFDPEKVGLKSAGYDGFLFNTTLPGNCNAGHEYGTKGLSKEDRLDLLEYLKTL